MKRFKEYIIDEWKLTNDSNIEKKPLFKFFPKSYNELKTIIISRLKENIEEPNLLDIDISGVSSLNNLFSGGHGPENDYHGDHYDYLYTHNIDMRKLKRLDLSTWDTSNVCFARRIFCCCNNLEEIKGIENWDLSKCHQFDGMFRCCKSLKNIDISNWKVSKYTSKSWMFCNCENLKEIKGIDKLKPLPASREDLTYMFLGSNDNIKPKWYNKEKWESNGF